MGKAFSAVLGTYEAPGLYFSSLHRVRWGIWFLVMCKKELKFREAK